MRTRRPSRLRRATKWVLAAACVALVVAWVPRMRRTPTAPPVSSSAEKWTNATPDNRDALMVVLADGGILEGKTENEVCAMLGEPDHCHFGHANWYFSSAGKRRVSGGPAMIVEFTREGVVRSRRLSAMGPVTSNTRFDAERWKTSTSEERGSMVRDFFATTPHEGIPKTQLYRILGPPDKESATGPFLTYMGRCYDEDGNIRKRLFGKKLYIGLKDGKVSSVVYSGDS